MKCKNNKGGFTLFEIIIVIIITGVLVSLVLPRLFNTVEYSKSSEALSAISTLKRAADQCNRIHKTQTGAQDNFARCDSFAELGVNDPSLAVSAIFSYAISNYSTPNWSVVATRLVPGAATGDTITFTYDTKSGTTTHAGTGAYSGLR